MQPEKAKAAAAKEKTTSAIKGVKQQIKKAKKTSKKGDKEGFNLMAEFEKLAAEPENLPKLQAILDRFKKVEEKAPIAQITENPTRKEVYRNGQRVWIYVAENGQEVRSDGSPLN